MIDWKAVLQAEERERILGSLTAVGPGKPIGYLPLRAIVDILGLRAAEVAADAHSRGLSSMTLLPGRCRIKSGAFYVYDRVALRRLLRKAVRVVWGDGLSTNPDRFVRQIAVIWFGPGDAVEPVIRAAFGDRVAFCDMSRPSGRERSGAARSGVLGRLRMATTS